MTKCRCMISVLVFGFWANAASASSSDSGYVAAPTVINTNVVYFAHDGVRTTPPACATDPRYVIDPNTTGAASMYATLLTASSSGRKVSVQGTSTCLSGTSNETVAWIVLN